MISLKLALRSVLRRRWGLALIILPMALLFGMATFMAASELALRQLTAPGIGERAIRIGSVEGIPSEYSQAEANQFATIPGVTVAPSEWLPCYTDQEDTTEFNCGFATRTYIQIWSIDTPVNDAELDHWDTIKNGVIVTRAAAEKHHWKVGDRFSVRVLKAPDETKAIEFEVAHIAEKYLDPRTIYVHLDYYEQQYKTPPMYWVVWLLVDTHDRRQVVMDDVDKRLKEIHRPHLIWPMEASVSAILSTSAVLRQSFRMAGVLSLFLVICLSVALLILSIDQRSTELATLLAVGYRRGLLARSVLAEGALLLSFAAFLGAICVWVPFHNNPVPFDPIMQVRVEWTAALGAVLFGTMLGIATAIIPAVRVFRLDVVESLR